MFLEKHADTREMPFREDLPTEGGSRVSVFLPCDQLMSDHKVWGTERNNVDCFQGRPAGAASRHHGSLATHHTILVRFILDYTKCHL